MRGKLALAEQVGNEAVKAKDRTAAITAYTRALKATGDCRALAARRAELQKLLELLRTKQPTSPSTSPKTGSSTPPSNADKLPQRNRKAARTQGDTDRANPSSTPSPNPNGRNW